MSVSTSARVDYVEQFARAAERFAIDVARGDIRATVATCPGWSVYDLVVHLGNVHAWAATIVETGRRAAEHNDEPASHKPHAVSVWYAAKAEDLHAVLRSADPAAACWNATGAGLTNRFWLRRQLYETLMHQVDLDLAAGRTTDLADELCTDAIAEVLTVFLPRMHARGHPCALVAPLTLRVADTTRAWTLVPHLESARGVPAQSRGSSPESLSSAPAAQPAPIGAQPWPSDRAGPPSVEHRVVLGADRIEAPVDVLLKLLWKRTAPDDPALTFTGDRERIDAFLASTLTP